MAERRQNRVRYETIISEIKEFGQNNFIEISRKKAITDDTENEFIQIARGYFRINYENNEPEKLYKKTVTIPTDTEMMGFLVENLEKVYKKSE